MAVASGEAAVEALRGACEDRVSAGTLGWRSSGGHAVAWDLGCPWIDVHDEGDVLVVLDGSVHDPPLPPSPSVALAARYRTEGTHVASGLLGEFVLAILDRTSGTLLVARDPVGVRPWYQAGAGAQHLGATDVATLASMDRVDTAIDEVVTLQYLAGLIGSQGKTFHRGIRTLLPGRTWHARGGAARTQAHHQWDVRPELDLSWEDAAARCRVTLDEAVGCRLPTGWPAASELSGGYDSSAVVGTALRLGHPDFVVGRLLFDGPRADERGYSDEVARHWGVPMVSAAPWIPTEEESVQLTRELRRPAPGPNFTMFVGLHTALRAVGRLESLTGLGGDDAFVAEPIGLRVVSAVQLRQARVLRQLAGAAARDPGHSWRYVVRPTLRHLAPWRGPRPPGWLSEAATKRADVYGALRRPDPHRTGVAAIDARLAGLVSGYGASILEDRALLADRLGRRDTHPFLDPRVVQVTYGLDPWWPVRGGHYRALQVHAYADRLPPGVMARRSKAEFSEIAWPQTLDDHTLSRVRTGPLRQAGWLDLAGFDEVVGRAREGRANAALPLSRCVAVDRWLRGR